jgi:hypothetical protein
MVSYGSINYEDTTVARSMICWSTNLHPTHHFFAEDTAFGIREPTWSCVALSKYSCDCPLDMASYGSIKYEDTIVARYMIWWSTNLHPTHHLFAEDTAFGLREPTWSCVALSKYSCDCPPDMVSYGSIKYEDTIVASYMIWWRSNVHPTDHFFAENAGFGIREPAWSCVALSEYSCDCPPDMVSYGSIKYEDTIVARLHDQLKYQYTPLAPFLCQKYCVWHPGIHMKLRGTFQISSCDCPPDMVSYGSIKYEDTILARYMIWWSTNLHPTHHFFAKDTAFGNRKPAWSCVALP